MTNTENAPTNIIQAAKDLTLVLLTLFGLKYSLLQFDAMWTFAGPISLISAAAVATWRLKASGESWASLGFIHSTSHLKLAFWTIGAFVLTILAGVLAGSIASGVLPNLQVSEQAGNFAQNRFANVPGNLPAYLYWLLVSWIVGGFTEELLFRGFLINRFEKLFKKVPFAVGIAIVIQALIFGQQHMYYLGVTGLVETGIIGIVSGAIYIICGRRLWPLIISHGLANTLGITMIYLGNAPGG